MDTSFIFRAGTSRYGDSIYFFSKNKLGWGAAQFACTSVGGDLVRVDNAAEDNWVKSESNKRK